MDEKIELTGSELKQLLNQRREEVRKKDSTDERIEITKLKEARIRIANIMTESQVVNLIYDFVKSKKKSLDFAGGDIAKHPGPDDSYRRELIKIGQRTIKDEQGENLKDLMHGKIEFNPAQESPRCSICKRAIKSGSYVRYENGVPIHRSCA